LFAEDIVLILVMLSVCFAQLFQAGIGTNKGAIISASSLSINCHMIKLSNGQRDRVVKSTSKCIGTYRSSIQHVSTKTVLPVGLPVTLAVEGRDAFFCSGAINIERYK
jgi:hypothetical protein